MQITLATDWAMRRSADQSKLFVELIASIGFVLLVQKHDDRERIIIPYGHPSLMNYSSKVMQSDKTRDMNSRGFIMSRWK